MTLDLSYYWEGGREFCDDNEWDGKKKRKKSERVLFFFLAQTLTGGKR